MRTYKLFLKSSLPLLAVLGATQQSYSNEAQDANNPVQQGHKRLRESSMTPQDLISSYPVIGERISEYLPFHDLCAMESVCKTFATSIANGMHYQVLLIDPENKNLWESSRQTDEQTYKELFLSLRAKSNLNFAVHLWDLWRDNFPLQSIVAELPKKSDYDKPLYIPLPHYWDKPITTTQLTTANSVYNSLYQLSLNNFFVKSPLFYKSIIGKILTTPLNNRNYREDRQAFTDLINQNDANCVQSTKITAQFRLAAMDLLGQGGPVNYDNARQGFNTVIHNNAATPQHRANAQLDLAEMNLLGLGGPVNYDNARQGFTAVIHNNAATPQHRANAQLDLAQMNLFGLGGPVNYDTARQGFTAVIQNNAATPQNRATAQLLLAQMGR